jgi:ribosomal protein S6
MRSFPADSSLTLLRLLDSLDFHELSALMKRVCLEIVDHGGIVRAIHNHGIRTLPHRFQARYPDKEGNRYYPRGRFVSLYYDSSPVVMRQVEQLLATNEDVVLRNTHLKSQSILDFVNISNEKYNPYLQQVAQQEEANQLQGERQPWTEVLDSSNQQPEQR